MKVRLTVPVTTCPAPIRPPSSRPALIRPPRPRRALLRVGRATAGGRHPGGHGRRLLGRRITDPVAVGLHAQSDRLRLRLRRGVEDALALVRHVG